MINPKRLWMTEVDQLRILNGGSVLCLFCVVHCKSETASVSF